MIVSSSSSFNLTLSNSDDLSCGAAMTPKECLSVASSFTQMLLKRLPDVVDGNPVKSAFSLAKIVLQIKDVRGFSLYRS